MSQPTPPKSQKVEHRRNDKPQGNAAVRRLAVQDGYELWAPAYDDDPNPLLALEERELRPLLPPLAGKAVIDVACGTGRWLRRLLGRGARFAVGVDFTPAMLNRAAAKALLRGHLIRADCLDLPFGSDMADILLCSFVIGHVHDLQALAHELARVARGQADVLVTDLHPAAQAQGWRCAFRHAGETIEIAGFPHSLEQIRQAFGVEGFRLVQSREPHLGEPERQIFIQAGKHSIFDSVCATPAIFIDHFQAVIETGARKQPETERR